MDHYNVRVGQKANNSDHMKEHKLVKFKNTINDMGLQRRESMLRKWKIVLGYLANAKSSTIIGFVDLRGKTKELCIPTCKSSVVTLAILLLLLETTKGMLSFGMLKARKE